MDVLREEGIIIPQYLNEEETGFEAAKGAGGGINVRFIESAMEGFGATVATRPLATAVPVGFVWMAVTTQDAWQSNGTDWVEV